MAFNRTQMLHRETYPGDTEAAIDRLFDRYGHIPPHRDQRLHALRQSALWLLQHHGQLTDRNTALLHNADAKALQQAIKRMAGARRVREPCKDIDRGNVRVPLGERIRLLTP